MGEEFNMEGVVVKIDDQPGTIKVCEKNPLFGKTTKERVEDELRELLDRISNLTKFCYGERLLKANLSTRMRAYLHCQLDTMIEYAKWLQARLKIWDMTDEEIYAMEHPDKEGVEK